MAKDSKKGFSRNVIPTVWQERAVSEARIEKIAHTLKPMVIDLIEKPFKRYCAAHTLGVPQSEVEWQRFRKFLVRGL